MVYFYVLCSKNILMKLFLINSLHVFVSRWNSWLESFRFHVNCIHFRGAVFVHVGLAQLFLENGVSLYMWSVVEAAWLAP